MPPPSRAQVLGRIRLRHLQCFLAVARLGSLRAAAEALSVTQPAVTKTLNELEEMLGTALLVRGRKGARLTTEAEAFLLHANASVNALSQAVDSVAGGAGEAALRIGVLPTVSAFVAQALLDFTAVRPLAALRVLGGRNAELVALLRSHELDAVIGRLAEPDAMVGISFEHLYAEPMLIALRPGHPLNRRRRPAPQELAAQPMILPLPGTLIRQVADSYLASRGIVPGAALIETLDTALARTLAQAGDHLWFTPAGAALADIAAGSLARLPLAITPEEPVGLMTRTDSVPSATLASLLTMLRKTAATRRTAAPAARMKLNRK